MLYQWKLHMNLFLSIFKFNLPISLRHTDRRLIEPDKNKTCFPCSLKVFPTTKKSSFRVIVPLSLSVSVDELKHLLFCLYRTFPRCCSAVYSPQRCKDKRVFSATFITSDLLSACCEIRDAQQHLFNCCWCTCLGSESLSTFRKGRQVT